MNHPAIRKNGGDVVSRLFNYGSLVLLLLWVGFSLFAFLWIMVTSLKTNAEFFSNVWSLFSKPNWDNYRKAWVMAELGLNFRNSIVVVLGSVISLLLLTTPAFYTLSRIQFRGSETLINLFTIGMGVPVQLLLVPLFFLLFRFRLIDSLFGLGVAYVATSIPFTTFLLLGYFRTLPVELEEAAAIDGCTPMQTFYKVMLPLASPGVLTAAIFNTVFLWNEVMLALTLISSNNKFTLSLGLSGLQGTMQYTGDWVSLFAGFTIVMLPSLVVYALLSRRIMEGLTAGATKG